MSETKAKNIIKLLLNSIIIREKQTSEFIDSFNNNKLFSIIENPIDLLPLDVLENMLELKDSKLGEIMYEDYGNMVDKDLNLDVELDKFIAKYIM